MIIVQLKFCEKKKMNKIHTTMTKKLQEPGKNNDLDQSKQSFMLQKSDQQHLHEQNTSMLKSSDNELSSYDLKQVLIKNNLDFLRQSNNCCDDGISDLRHESLNHLLKQNIELVKNQNIDLKPMHLAENLLNDTDCHHNHHDDEDNNNNLSQNILHVHHLQNAVDGNKSVDEQFSQLIEDESNGRDDDKVSFSYFFLCRKYI